MIKLKRDEVTRQWTLYIGEHAFIHPTNDWEQLINVFTGKCTYNWYTFSFINLYFENDIMCPGFEVEAALLGLGFRLRINRSWEGTEIQERLNDVKDWVDEIRKEERTLGQVLADLLAIREGLVGEYSPIAYNDPDITWDCALCMASVETTYEGGRVLPCNDRDFPHEQECPIVHLNRLIQELQLKTKEQQQESE